MLRFFIYFFCFEREIGEYVVNILRPYFKIRKADIIKGRKEYLELISRACKA